MARLVKALVVIISLAAGLLAARESFWLLPPWAGESRSLVAIDAAVLLLALFLAGGAAYYSLKEMGRWLSGRAGRRRESEPRPLGD